MAVDVDDRRSLSPWQSPSSESPRPTVTQTWEVRKPLVAGDLRSISTVTTTTSSSRSNSPGSSHDGKSPLSTSPVSSPRPVPQSHISNESPLDEFEALDIPPDNDILIQPASNFSQPASNPASCNPPRTLPRCAVVNFRRDGETLRWAPRVTQNRGGVAAKAHNFEDAFSLEEFSSTALPVLWHARGGNPRLSAGAEDLASRNAHTRTVDQIPLRSALSVPFDHRSPGIPSQLAPTNPVTRTTPETKRSKSSVGSSQHLMVNSPSFKRAVAIANEVTRPSFWSILAHTNKYQKTKAKARIHNDEIPGGRESASATSADRKKGTAVKKRIWSGLSGKRIPKLQRAGHRESTDEKKAKGKKSNTSLFRKLVSQLERRNGKKTSPSAAAASAAAATTSTATARESQDRSKESTKAFRRSLDAAIGNDSLKFHGRSKSLWKPARNADYEHPGRRVMSSLTGSANRKTRDLENVNAGDDQYVTFITSVA